MLGQKRRAYARLHSWVSRETPAGDSSPRVPWAVESAPIQSQHLRRAPASGVRFHVKRLCRCQRASSSSDSNRNATGTTVRPPQPTLGVEQGLAEAVRLMGSQSARRKPGRDDRSGSVRPVSRETWLRHPEEGRAGAHPIETAVVAGCSPVRHGSATSCNGAQGGNPAAFNRPHRHRAALCRC